MEPISFLIGALVLTAFAKVGIAATSDAYATVKAAQAGAWDVIDRQRERRASFWERAGRAWADRRRRRHEAAGGDGVFRPGVRAYAADLYHGFWEDQLERRTAKRAARPPYVHDPDAPRWHERFDAAVLDKVERAREKWGQRRTEPVADTPIDDLFDQEALPELGPVVHEPGTWTVDDRGERVELTPAEVDEPDNVSNEPDDATEGANIETAGGTTMTAPTAAAVATEVNTNEDARRNFAVQIAAANRAADALEAYERAQADLAAAAGGGVDGMSAKRYDAGATAAQANIADLISVGDIAAASGAIEGIRAEAESGVRSLDKYQDAEAQVAEEGIDATTLAATSS